MASTSTSDRVTMKLFDNIEKLKSDGSNWDMWKIEDWDQFNLEAQIQIFMTLDYEVASLVNGKEVAADLWSALKSHFEGKGLMAVAMLTSKLWQYNILAENDVSM